MWIVSSVHKVSFTDFHYLPKQVKSTIPGNHTIKLRYSMCRQMLILRKRSISVYMYYLRMFILCMCVVAEKKQWKNMCAFFFFFLRPHSQQMEVLRLGVQSEIKPPAYTIATTMPDSSRDCDLYQSSQQHRIPHPLSESGDQTRILMDTSLVCHRWAMTQTPTCVKLLKVCINEYLLIL